MPVTLGSSRIFSLDNRFDDPVRRRMFDMMAWPVERLLLFHHLNKAYEDVQLMRDQRPFLEKVLDRLNIRYTLSEDDFSRLAVANKPVIVVANHPYGGIEGIILASLLRSVRSDVKFMANAVLDRIPELRDVLIPVDPFGREGSLQRNLGPLRECIRWVGSGGMLVVFPAGEVSHFDPLRGVVDPAWNANIAKLVRRTGAPVIPVFFDGTNSMKFHAAGMVHPALRTALLPAELLNKGKRTIRVAAGRLIPHDRLSSFGTDEAMAGYLRCRTEALAHRAQGERPPATARKNADEPLAAPQSPQYMAYELERLGPDRLLAEHQDLAVFLAEGEDIPATLLEIGRLRELNFRAVGEGTGMAIDLDRFDEHYHHLVLWNRQTREIAGAYRIGRTDRIMSTNGIRGLYTRTLFAYGAEFIDRLGPAMELGRSFVRPEYQKSYVPLMLLWKGIGRFLVRNPRYRTLFGPVSISNRYQPLSRHLMARFLGTRCSDRELAALVRPVTPFRSWKPFPRDWRMFDATFGDADALSDLIADIEPDGKGIPILLRHYLKLGGKIAGFNVDRAFGNALDGLIVVDLARTDRRVLERYMGRDGADAYLRRQHEPTGDRLIVHS